MSFSKESQTNILSVKNFGIECFTLSSGDIISYAQVSKVYLNRFFDSVGDVPCWKLYIVIEYTKLEPLESLKAKFVPRLFITNEIQDKVHCSGDFDSSTVANVLINFLDNKLDKQVIDFLNGREISAFDIDFYPGEEVDKNTDLSFTNTTFTISHK